MLPSVSPEGARARHEIDPAEAMLASFEAAAIAAVKAGNEAAAVAAMRVIAEIRGAARKPPVETPAAPSVASLDEARRRREHGSK